MPRRDGTSFRIWAAATLAGVALVGFFTLLFRLPKPPAPPAKPPEGAPSVHLNGVSQQARDPIFSADASLLDPTPLFIPTRWNSSGKEIQPPEPGRQFAGYVAEMSKDDLNPIKNPVAFQSPDRPEDVLSGTPPGAPFLGFGQKDVPMVALPERGAYVEVFESTSGRSVFARALAPSVHAPGGDGWQPMEFIAAVDPDGLVGPVVRTVSSGAETVDNFFTAYLAENLKVGHRLAPGFYRISVGP